jgi:glycosyltransferase involved in cell wall biosynthesis
MRLLMLNSSCCWRKPTTPFLQLGEALAARGVDVRHVVGGGSVCSFYGTLQDWNDTKCATAQDRVTQSIHALGNPVRNIRDYETPEMHARVEAWWREQQHVAPDAREYRGFRMRDLIRGSLSRHLYRPLHPLADAPGNEENSSPEDREAAHRMTRAAALAIEVAEAVLLDVQPDCVLLFNGYFYLEWIFSATAKRMGIRTVAHELACFADRLFFDDAGVIGNRHRMSSGEIRHLLDVQQLSPLEQQELESYLCAVLEGRVNTISQSETEDLESLRKRLGIPADRRIILQIGQVAYDTVVVYDAGTYPTSLEFLRAGITAAQEMPDCHLVIRLHPHEMIVNNNWTWRQVSTWELPENVSVVHSRDANTYQLMQLADCGIAMTSQAGLEMAAFGKPVVVCGNAFYAGNGFTYDVNSPDGLVPALNRALADGPLTGERKRRIDTFLYHHIFRYLVPFDNDNDRFSPEAVARIHHICDPIGGRTAARAADKAAAVVASRRAASDFPRILLVNEVPFGNATGYAVTLSNLFRGWPRDRIAQIYRRTEYEPDTTLCQHNLALWDPHLHGAKKSWRKPLRPFEYSWKLRRGDFDTFKDTVNTGRAYAWARPFRPDVIFTSPTSYAAARFALELSQRLGVPFVCHTMDDWLAPWEQGARPLQPMPGEGIRQQWRNRTAKQLFARAASRQVISEAMAAAFQQRYGHAFKVIHNALDLSHWNLGPKDPGGVGTPFTIRYTGAIWNNIQMPTLALAAEAIAELAAAGEAVRLEIYTHESFARQYESALRREPHVVFRPLLPYAEMPALMHQADALLLPVTFDEQLLLFSRYSMPTKVPEYMISGAPSILFGPRDAAPVAYARQHGWGVVVDQPDKEALKAAILRLMREPQFRQAAAAPAQALAREHHNLDALREAFWDDLIAAAR